MCKLILKKDNVFLTVILIQNFELFTFILFYFIIIYRYLINNDNYLHYSKTFIRKAKAKAKAATAKQESFFFFCLFFSFVKKQL